MIFSKFHNSIPRCRFENLLIKIHAVKCTRINLRSRFWLVNLFFACDKNIDKNRINYYKYVNKIYTIESFLGRNARFFSKEWRAQRKHPLTFTRSRPELSLSFPLSFSLPPSLSLTPGVVARISAQNPRTERASTSWDISRIFQSILRRGESRDVTGV